MTNFDVRKSRRRDLCLKYLGLHVDPHPDREPTLPCFGFPVSTTGNDDPLTEKQIRETNRIIANERRNPFLRKLLGYILG